MGVLLARTQTQPQTSLHLRTEDFITCLVSTVVVFVCFCDLHAFLYNLMLTLHTMIFDLIFREQWCAFDVPRALQHSTVCVLSCEGILGFIVTYVG